MKKIKLFTILGVLIGTGTLVNAELQQAWQVDITPYFDTFVPSGHTSARLCDDGQTLITATSGSQGCLLVIGDDGNLVDKDLFTAKSIFSVHGQSPSTFFTLYYEVSNSVYATRYYELISDSLSVTNIPAMYLEDTRPKRNEFIHLDGMTLTKYRYVANESTITVPAMGVNGTNFVISWDSEIGANYTVQSSINLTNWVNTGVTLSGTGDPMTWANVMSNSPSYYRLIIE